MFRFYSGIPIIKKKCVDVVHLKTDDIIYKDDNATKITPQYDDYENVFMDQQSQNGTLIF